MVVPEVHAVVAAHLEVASLEVVGLVGATGGAGVREKVNDCGSSAYAVSEHSREELFRIFDRVPVIVDTMVHDDYVGRLEVRDAVHCKHPGKVEGSRLGVHTASIHANLPDRRTGIGAIEPAKEILSPAAVFDTHIIEISVARGAHKVLTVLCERWAAAVAITTASASVYSYCWAFPSNYYIHSLVLAFQGSICRAQTVCVIHRHRVAHKIAKQHTVDGTNSFAIRSTSEVLIQMRLKYLSSRTVVQI